MSNELDWLRSKARHSQTETMLISPEEAATLECKAGAYKIERWMFEGSIPARMARKLRGVKLINTETEHEVLHLGTGYVGGEGRCRYYRSTYTLVYA